MLEEVIKNKKLKVFVNINIVIMEKFKIFFFFFSFICYQWIAIIQRIWIRNKGVVEEKTRLKFFIQCKQNFFIVLIFTQNLRNSDGHFSPFNLFLLISFLV